MRISPVQSIDPRPGKCSDSSGVRSVRSDTDELVTSCGARRDEAANAVQWPPGVALFVHVSHKVWETAATLRNRRFLEQELEPLVVSQRVRGKDLCGVMIDLDNFKRYNDSCGHQAGDELLRFVGELLNGALRQEDHAIRVGGDEFLLLLPDVGSDEATRVVERVQRLFGQYTHQVVDAGRVSMSAGIATIMANACINGRELIAEADKALYHVKQNGKSAVCAAGTT